MKAKTLVSWSSGKDCAWVLHLLRQDSTIDLRGLFTVVNQKYDRVSMHGARIDLLRRQAKAADMPLSRVYVPDPCTNEAYDAIMGQFIEASRARGITHIAFGDLFLEDIRQYREHQLHGTGIEPLFPLWGIPTLQLASQMLTAGVKAYVSSVDLKQLPACYAGKEWSGEMVKTLPEGVDPCGERGEFHTIVVAGPMFRHPIPITIGEIVEREGFAYADIIPS